MKQLYPYKGMRPKVDESAFIAPGAILVGDVEVGEGSSIWYNVTIRADVNPVKIGKWSNIQDASIIHEDSGRGSGLEDGLATIVGDYVTVGHGVILHACKLEDYALVGMGATVMDGAVVGKGSVIGAGALVTKGTVIPPYSVVLGAPAKVIRTMTPDSIADRLEQAEHYHHLSREHMESLKEDN